MPSYNLAQLAALSRANPTRLKVLFVPSLQTGNNLTAALTLSGHSWANLQTTTPAAWATQVVEPALQASGWRPVQQDLEAFWVRELLESLHKREGEAFSFGKSVGSGLADSFLRTIRVLRNAGVEPDEIGGAGLDPGKAGLLATVYREYCGFLEGNHYYDDARVFRLALDRLKNGSGVEEMVFAILDETPLPRLAYEYLQTLAGPRLYRIGRQHYGIPPPAHSAAARFPEAPFPETDQNSVGPGGRLLSDGLSREDSDRVQLREALGSENEVRGILRELLSEGIPLDTVEIAYTTESPYLTLLCDAAERYNIPVAFASGIPVTLTRPGQALLGFYRWVASGLRGEELVGICRAGMITFNTLLSPGETLEPHHLAAILLRGRVRQGKAGYGEALSRLGRMDAPADPDQKADRSREPAPGLSDLPLFRRVVEALLGLAPDGQKAPVRAMAEYGIQYLQRFVPTRSENDALAQESLVDRLRAIGEAIDAEDDVSRTARIFLDMIAEHKVGASAARPGHLYVTPLDRAGYSHRQCLFVVGMDERSFPGGAGEDPILLDDERQRISPELGFQRTRPAEQVWNLVRALGMAPGPVTLLAKTRDLSDGREIYPSPQYYQAQKQLRIETPLLLGPVPDEGQPGLDPSEWMLRSRSAPGYEEAVHRSFPWLTRGEVAALAREGFQLTRFDGWLGRETPDLALSGTEAVLSASRLETLTRCPYQYFLRYVLRVEPPDEPEEDPTCWLTPLDFGALLHRLFSGFMQALDAQKELPDLDKHGDLIRMMLEEEIRNHQEYLPVTHEAAYRADVRRLERAARIFLTSEAKQAGRQPLGFEVSFGLEKTDGLNQEAPISLRLSEAVQFRLRGSIDRVDRAGEEYIIWDYKTGSTSRYDERDLLKKGTHLQWALYAYALEQIMASKKQPGRVMQSGYFFPSERGNGRRISGRPSDPSSLGEMLEPLFKLVEKGCFFRVQKEEQCKYCDYNRLCGGEHYLPKDLENFKEVGQDQAETLDLLNRWMNA